jgi:hypothetical protein
MSKKEIVQLIGLIIAFTAVLIALLAWFFPYNSVGNSPLIKNSENVVSSNEDTSVLADCKPILFFDDFNSSETNQKYTGDNVSVVNDRLKLIVNDSERGAMTSSLGQYDAFTIEFFVFPVGEIYDGSANIIFGKHDDESYELQLRLRDHQFQFLKNELRNGQIQLTGIGWTTDPGIELGSYFTKIKLSADPGTYTFWVNDKQIYTFIDNDNPFLRGNLYLGIGSGETSPVSMEIDNVTVCGH